MRPKASSKNGVNGKIVLKFTEIVREEMRGFMEDMTSCQYDG